MSVAALSASTGEGTSILSAIIQLLFTLSGQYTVFDFGLNIIWTDRGQMSWGNIGQESQIDVFKFQPVEYNVCMGFPCDSELVVVFGTDICVHSFIWSLFNHSAFVAISNNNYLMGKRVGDFNEGLRLFNKLSMMVIRQLHPSEKFNNALTLLCQEQLKFMAVYSGKSTIYIWLRRY